MMRCAQGPVLAALFAASLSVLCAASTARAQVWVFFADKGPNAASRLASASPAQLGLSDETMLRRHGAMAIEDLPIHPPYLDAVRNAGAVIRATSKWLNAVSVHGDSLVLARVRRLACVTSTQPVRRWRSTPGIETPQPVFPGLWKGAAGASLSYGESRPQLDPIAVPRVHGVWIDGTDITVGMLDNGFRWRSHEAMNLIKVLGEYDFINRDSVTENQDGDPAGQDGHGTLTFSALAGYKNGVLIGPAFNASYYLAKTEVNGSETPIEEDYYVEGLEWLEAHGVAVSSSSLGYSIWDDNTGYRYENGDFDGRTAVTTRAAVRAARLGVVVVTAMGNEGNSPGTLIAPADADSIISVGACTFDGTVAGFSSNGPTNDGRIKPDIIAPGVSVFSASTYAADSYTWSNGTSLATPLAAGVAALVRSARPELTPIQVRDALRTTASHAADPNSSHGWGVVNAWAALLYHGMVISTHPKVVWDGSKNIIAAWVVSPSPVQQQSVTVTYSVNGGSDRTGTMQFLRSADGADVTLGAGSGLYALTLPILPAQATVRYSISAADTKEQRTSPYAAPQRRHVFTVGSSDDVYAEDLLPRTFALETPSPHPLCSCSNATVRFDVPVPGAQVELAVHDLLGRRIAVLSSGFIAAGSHTAVIDAASLGSGVQFLSLTSGDVQIVRPLVVIK